MKTAWQLVSQMENSDSTSSTSCSARVASTRWLWRLGVNALPALLSVLQQQDFRDLVIVDSHLG
jgi:hypothetical protein